MINGIRQKLKTEMSVDDYRKWKVSDIAQLRLDAKRCSVSVRCLKCHARGPVAGIQMPDGRYNEVELVGEKASESWNNRI